MTVSGFSNIQPGGKYYVGCVKNSDNFVGTFRSYSTGLVQYLFESEDGQPISVDPQEVVEISPLEEINTFSGGKRNRRKSRKNRKSRKSRRNNRK
jgi:hypothetical protein